MKWRKGPRPWTIWAFACGWTFLVSENLLSALPPYSQWENSEKTVVRAFSIFTAGMIPVIAIFGFGSRFARAFATFMSLAFIATLVMQLWAWAAQDHFDITTFAHNTAILISVALLYHPASKPWFQKKKDWCDPELDF